MAPEEHTYHAQDALAIGINSTLVMGGIGTFVSAIQNSMTRQNIGAMQVFTRTGTTIAVFAGMGGSYAFAKAASANLREKEDSINPTIGGFLAGMVLGLRYRTFPSVIGYGIGIAVTMGGFDYAGGKLTGAKADPEVDEFERKQRLRAEKRRPIQETLEELGEGRGIYGPGYAERRRERLKQRYGIDVPETPVSA